MEVCLCKILGGTWSFPRQMLHSHHRRRWEPPTTVVLAKRKGLSAATDEEEWMKAARLEEKSGGLVEILECLEREAIMGEDHGRDPHDYNRRAQIFDKSSKVFQALKERTVLVSDTSCIESSST